MPNPVVHFGLIGKDGEALQKFYSDAFDWKIDANNPMNYGMVDTGAGEAAIGGGIAAGEEAQAVFYVQVDDPAAALEKIKGLDGGVVQDVRYPGHGHDRDVQRPRGQPRRDRRR